LLHRAGHAVLELVVALLMLLMLLLLKSRHALELRTGKGSWCTRLEGAAKQQLGRQKGGELHVKCSTRGSHVHSMVGRLLGHGLRLSIDGGNVSSSRVSISEA